MINYNIKYDIDGTIKITDEIAEVIKEFGFNPNNGKELLELFVPTKSSYYHSQPTPVFFNTHLLSEAANYKKKHGVYCSHPYKSKGYNEYWKEQKRRCIEGFTINKGTEFELSITGYHYFYLNFKQIQLTVKTKTKGTIRERDFPKFYSSQYHLFWAYEECVRDGEHLILLKARGIGASEVFSCIPTCNYTFYKENNFLFAQDEGKLLGDGVFSKVNEHLDYLFNETERAFRHLRTGTESNQVLKKRASTKLKSGANKITGGYIEGRILDREDKARGSRGMFIGFEEGGSFKDLVKKVQVAKPSVEEDMGRSVFGTIAVWGTGGSSNEYVEGLETLFYAPSGWKFKEFINYWDKSQRGRPCGFFLPAYATFRDFMDADGNCDELRAYLFIMQMRHNKSKVVTDLKALADAVAENPLCPQEALVRKGFSPFNLASVNNQINYIYENKLDNLWVNGSLQRTKEGKVKFHPDSKLKRFDKYPVPTENTEDKKGCISILEAPLKIQGEVPKNLYTIAVDNYTNDLATASHSVGACYVIKNDNHVFNRNNLNGNIVAEYVGRPERIETFWDNIFLLAEYYNTTINFELRGGGQTAITEARKKKKVHLLEGMPSILRPKSTKEDSKQLGVTFTEDTKHLAIKYLADWLEDEVAGKVDEEGNVTYIKRIQSIYSLGLLQELRNFVDKDNYDRIDALKLAVMCVKNNEYLDKKPKKDERWKAVLELLS